MHVCAQRRNPFWKQQIGGPRKGLRGPRGVRQGMPQGKLDGSVTFHLEKERQVCVCAARVFLRLENKPLRKKKGFFFVRREARRLLRERFWCIQKSFGKKRVGYSLISFALMLVYLLFSKVSKLVRM
ncbi:hypothetical protein TNCV_2617711 [Trichonephila clavipes]|nr:hypothetical protein TNCV_2617711 [Trichonephila clavipes]